MLALQVNNLCAPVTEIPASAIGTTSILKYPKEAIDMLSRSQLLGLSTQAQDCFAVVESLQKFISVALDLVDLTNPLSSLNKVAIVLQVYSGSMDTQLKELKCILEGIRTYALTAVQEEQE